MIIAAREHGIRVFGYSTRQVKQGITGRGGATRDDVEIILRALLHLRAADLSPDASDALSIALHHIMENWLDRKNQDLWLGEDL